MASQLPADEIPDALPPFEQSFAELQQIAHDLEDGVLGLEESLKRYERGIVLLRECYRTLEQAEQRIAILSGFDASGNAITKPFDASATADPAVAPSAGRRKRSASKSGVTPAKPKEESAPAPPPEEPTDEGSRLF